MSSNKKQATQTVAIKKVRPIAAPNMGSLANSTEIFKRSKAAYVRGGDTPPTRALEEACVKFLGRYDGEGEAPYALCTNSGHSANVVTFQTLSGGDLVASKFLFGTTKAYLKQIHEEEAGNKVVLVDPRDTQAFIDATVQNPNITAWFAEAPQNPTMMVPHLTELSVAAKEMGIVLVIDATMAAGMPAFEGLKYADVLTTSLTKQAGGGENLVVGGSILVNSNFAWHDQAKKFPQLHKRLGDEMGSLLNPFGDAAAKNSVLRGPGTISPRDAITITEAFPTMQERVRKMCRNARIAADQLSGYKNVREARLVGYNTNPNDDARMQRHMGDNAFAMIVDMEDMNAVRDVFGRGVFPNAVALGQAYNENAIATFAHPASSTHRQYTPEDLQAAGFGQTSIRVSVGAGCETDVREKFELAFAG